MSARWLEESIWDEENIAHVARHGVTEQEAESVMFDPASMTAETYHPLRTVFVGLTDLGRFLTVVVARVGQHQGRVITARSASEKERAAYKDWRRGE